ncbi:hypothetical protein LTR17_012669 [Elasticomyces elasticus]|nr:hypothetical protein LTR17_012669 [Elasticomyces elasticus]
MHKIIVCSQSPFFAKACDGEFEEAQQGVITLREDDPLVVAAMFSFMYTCDYLDDPEPDSKEGTSPIVFDVHVHILADKYDLPDLAKLATEKFEKRAQMEWKDETFAEAAELVYTVDAAVTAPLRETVLAVAIDHAGDLTKDDIGARFQQAANTVPALGLSLWRKQVANVPGGYVRCECPKGNGSEALVSTSFKGGVSVWCTSCSTYHKVEDWTKYKI